MTNTLSQSEREDNWQAIRDEYLAKPGLAVLKKLRMTLPQHILSERLSLSKEAIAAVQNCATEEGDRIIPLLDFVLPPLLKLCARPNKIAIAYATAALKDIIKSTNYPEIIHHLVPSLKNLSKTLRLAAIECILACLETFNERNSRKEIENSIIIAIVDSMPEVRTVSKKIFELYQLVYSDHVDVFVNSLDDVARKYLGVERKTITKPTLDRKLLVEMKKDIDKKESKLLPSRSLALASEDKKERPAFGTIKRLLEKPLRVVNEVQETHLIKTTNLGGAQRVSVQILPPAPPTASTANSAKPGRIQHFDFSRKIDPDETEKLPEFKETPLPTRVTSPHKTPTKIPTPKRKLSEVALSTSPSLAPEKTVQKAVPLNLKSEEPRSRSTSQKAPVTKQVSLIDILASLKSNDWSSRVATFSQLNTFYESNSTFNYSKAILTQLVDAYISGINDTHWKVNNAALVSISVFISRTPPSDFVLNSILPRVSGIKNSRIKSGVLAACTKLIQDFKTVYGASACFFSLLNSLSIMEYVRLKYRNGILNVLMEFGEGDVFESVGKCGNMKSFLMRILAVFNDEKDLMIVKFVESFVVSTCVICRDSFWIVFRNLNGSEKRDVLKLLNCENENCVMEKIGVVSSFESNEENLDRTITINEDGDQTVVIQTQVQEQDENNIVQEDDDILFEVREILTESFQQVDKNISMQEVQKIAEDESMQNESHGSENFYRGEMKVMKPSESVETLHNDESDVLTKKNDLDLIRSENFLELLRSTKDSQSLNVLLRKLYANDQINEDNLDETFKVLVDIHDKIPEYDVENILLLEKIFGKVFVTNDMNASIRKYLLEQEPTKMSLDLWMRFCKGPMDDALLIEKLQDIMISGGSLGVRRRACECLAKLTRMDSEGIVNMWKQRK